MLVSPRSPLNLKQNETVIKTVRNQYYGADPHINGYAESRKMVEIPPIDLHSNPHIQTRRTILSPPSNPSYNNSGFCHHYPQQHRLPSFSPQPSR